MSDHESVESGQEALLWLKTRWNQMRYKILLGSLVGAMALSSLYLVSNCEVTSELPHSVAIGLNCKFPAGVRVYASEGLVPDNEIARAATVLVTSPYGSWFQGGVFFHHDGKVDTFGGIFPREPRLIAPTPIP